MWKGKEQGAGWLTNSGEEEGVVGRTLRGLKKVGRKTESLTFRMVVALAPDATGELVAWTKRKSLSSRGQAP